MRNEFQLNLVFSLQVWQNVEANPNGYSQWQSKGVPFLMLNTDIALCYPLNISILPTGQQCGPSSLMPGVAKAVYSDGRVCNVESNTSVLTATRALVKLYARNETAFHEAFRDSFVKLTSVGYRLLDDGPSGQKTGLVDEITSLKFGDLHKLNSSRCLSHGHTNAYVSLSLITPNHEV